MDALLRDIRYAVRGLLRSPGFTFTVLGLLCLSIGGLTAVFSAIDAVLLRPLPGVTEPERVAWLSTVSRFHAQPQGLSYPEFSEFQEHLPEGIEAIAGYDAPYFNLANNGDPVRVRGQLVAGSYFEVLGARPLLGRFFDAPELAKGAGRAVVVLGQHLWRDRFGADPAAVGRTVVVNGVTFTIIGVAEAGFEGPELGAEAALWLPLGAAELAVPDLARDLGERDRRFLRVLVRTAPGVRRERAEAAVVAMARGIAAEQDEAYDEQEVRLTPVSGGIAPDVRQDTRWLAGLFAAIAVLVVFMGCLNIANLLLARAAHRRHETSIRLALGASRVRLMRQFFTESAVLAAAGGLAGLALAFSAIHVIGAAFPSAQLLDLHVSPRVLLVVLVTTCGTGVLFGVAPAVHSSRTLSAGLAGWGRGSSGTRGMRGLQRAFVVAQMGASLVVLVAAGQFLMAIRSANKVDLGFSADDVTAFSYDLVLQQYTQERRSVFERETVERISAVPGVTSVALADVAPLSGIMVLSAVSADGSEGPTEATVGMAAVSPGYFETLRIPLVAGRGFSPSDERGAPLVAIVNERAAQVFWPDGDVLGKTIHTDGGTTVVEVVGVARNAKYDEPSESSEPFLYVPRAQRVLMDRTTVLVRSGGQTDVRPEALKAVVREMDSALPVFDLRGLPAVVRSRMDRQDTTAGLLTLFGVVGLTIATVGLYGVASYSVSQRTREFGVRMALGSSPGGIIRMVFRGGLVLVGMGAAGGSLLAIPLTLVLSKSVFGVGAGSVGVFVLAATVLCFVGLVASVVPARRAARTDPVGALHSE